MDLTVVLAAAALVWFGTVAAVLHDARARVANPAAARAAGVLAVLLPLGGAALWLCVRPAETLADRRLQRLALAVAEALADDPARPQATATVQPRPADAAPGRTGPQPAVGHPAVGHRAVGHRAVGHRAVGAGV